MNHGVLTEASVSRSLIDHIGKGREGKGRETGRESCRDVSCGSESQYRIRSNGDLGAGIGFGVDQ